METAFKTIQQYNIPKKRIFLSYLSVCLGGSLVAAYRILVANPEERDYLGKIDIDDSITFMLTINK